MVEARAEGRSVSPEVVPALNAAQPVLRVKSPFAKSLNRSVAEASASVRLLTYVQWSRSILADVQLDFLNRVGGLGIVLEEDRLFILATHQMLRNINSLTDCGAPATAESML